MVNNTQNHQSIDIRHTWFEIDRNGLQEISEKKHILRELVANVFDEQVNGATTCWVLITPNSLVVADNSPNGFANLSDSYTLFRSTPKRRSPETRGRFNMGEKVAISHADEAKIISTTGTVQFNQDGTRCFYPDKTQEGSKILLNMITADIYEDFLEFLIQIKLPKGFYLHFTENPLEGEENIIHHPPLSFRKPDARAAAVLPTWYLDDETRKVIPRRKTEIFIYKESEAWIYEMGIPIQKLDGDRFSYDVQQKVPLDQNRDTVSGSYLKEVRGAVANSITRLLNEDDRQSQWFTDALSSKNIKEEVFKDAVDYIYPKTVLRSNNPLANEQALLSGYSVIPSSQVPKVIRDKLDSIEERDNREILPSANKFGPSLTATRNVLRSRDLSVQMSEVQNITEIIARGINLKRIRVEFFTTTNEKDAMASFSWKNGLCLISFNVTKLGDNWFRFTNAVEIISLIIHELAHHVGTTDTVHINMKYLDEVVRLGGLVSVMMLKMPEKFNYFTQ
jgi:hypothetical protein